ncbi:aminoacyl-tRNA hydrolase [Parvularcula sp. ZS-1/3]|uniref:Peptidyl-tRNA hydrolase n=1 Tax=Parvularcula mediterranea TaxID=2732508 RepID=A0A7Y3RJM5_9PROT|nr:aminoacyl-tRNA hydrolase [Parvularcula mediterranea]NNU15283.1 aminoacyl-tRNA hydrolase [Parvularcula mediterranea]
MFLLVGLGNPGAKYQGNRHNAGFMAIDAIADGLGLGAFRSKFQAEVTDGKIGTERVLLMKPQTFYNESGRAVQEACRFHKIPPEDVLVFHDEIDLAPGKLRIKKGGGLAGNNGLKSIAAHLSPDVWRCRIGVGHPGHKDAVTHHVLKDFAKEERDGWFGEMLYRMGPAAKHLLPLTDENTQRFVSAVFQPPKAEKKAPRAEAKPKPQAPPPPEKTPSAFDALKGLIGKKD